MYDRDDKTLRNANVIMIAIYARLFAIYFIFRSSVWGLEGINPIADLNLEEMNYPLLLYLGLLLGFFVVHIGLLGIYYYAFGHKYLWKGILRIVRPTKKGLEKESHVKPSFFRNPFQFRNGQIHELVTIPLLFVLGIGGMVITFIAFLPF